MKKIITLLSILFLFVSLGTKAQTWHVEAEDPTSTVTWKNGTATIVAPKGLTLWCEEKMEGNVVIEYEARIVGDRRFKDEQGNVRVSDLNCFWMADKCGGYGGKFVDNYALRTYYVGYGGNWNTTTRFRRYTGDARGIDSAAYRPIILKEYTDKEHLLVKDKWYKIRLEQVDGHARYFIDGELLVDYVDPTPLTEGYFGFRTTLAKAELRNFKYECRKLDEEPIVLKWIGGIGSGVTTFGVPFSKGEVTEEAFTLQTDKGIPLPFDTWRLASWQDESAKWQAFTTIVPEGTDSVLLIKKPSAKLKMVPPYPLEETFPPFYVTLNREKCPILTHEIESKGDIREVHKYMGKNFIIRTYQYAGRKEMKLVHTLLVDSALNKEGLKELSIHFKVPMHGKPYERFADFEGKPMSVQPLIARRNIDLERMDATTLSMLQNIAQWDGFRLSQLSPNGYSIRKRATHASPWIGTMEGRRHDGTVTIGTLAPNKPDGSPHYGGDVRRTERVFSFHLQDFWQSYPSTLQVDGMRSDTAIVTISLYSPEAEPYSFEHYDTIAHTLEAAYEDVQPGMSTAWGIGRTSTIYISSAATPLHRYSSQLVCTPEYLHRKRAFGIWSLPTLDTPRDSLIESTLSGIMQFYEKEIERNHWYGFFNYGDVMHAYDAFRDEWRYDVGGYAWDNTELGTPAMLWYQFLRTGDPDVWRMAEAMTRHCSEVDTYHTGPHAGLGSRHNVTHWGCGAKEARISEAWWNRFYYYLTADERTGDIMHEVADADTLLYILDPMRLAQPRELYPCTAPARLRIGPDWLAYASNWLTEWERRETLSPTLPHDGEGDLAANFSMTNTPNGSPHYGGDAQRAERVLLAGMSSIASFPFGFYQGPLALGYDPATGILTSEVDPPFASTNHLMAIMGGFELINEMEPMIECPAFYQKWLEHNRLYKENAWNLKKNKFLIPRLSAYAGWRLGDEHLKQQAWDDLLHHIPLTNRQTIWTNDCATWTLDAIFLKETINQ
ncbi:MAG: hypothetical protein IJ693_10810 [Bacteroidaceae bacterium]|nr:hypothetical protein [Bacteroidaceae bacterium]